MIVSHDPNADYQSIQAAIDSIPEENKSPVTIFIKPGVYNEKLHITKPFVTLVGENAKNTIISYGDYAKKLFSTGQTYGTFNSYTAFIGANDFTARNITFENTSGIGEKVGQAVAAYVDGDRAAFINCHFLGYQDTLFTGPLPPAPLTPGSFRGPRENAPRINGRQYYENCFIKGDIDFIFGSATAFFYKCEIFSNDLGKKVNGYITAPSTAEGQEYGYVFDSCRLTSDAADETIYLGRPWRHFAKSVFLNCEIGPHIIREGWHDWDKPDSHHSTFFAEGNNTGKGSGTIHRPEWIHQLSPADFAHYSRENVLHGLDHWTPWE